MFKISTIEAKTTSTTALIAGICGAGIVGLILVAVLVIVIKRKKHLERGKLLHLKFGLLT